MFKLVYSGYHLRIDKALFTKQKCQFRMGIAQNKDLVMLLTTRDINTTHQHFQMSYVTFFLAQGAQKFQLK